MSKITLPVLGGSALRVMSALNLVNSSRQLSVPIYRDSRYHRECSLTQKRYLRGQGPRRLPQAQTEGSVQEAAQPKDIEHESNGRDKLRNTRIGSNSQAEGRQDDVKVKSSRVQEMLQNSAVGIKGMTNNERRQQSRHAARPDINPKQTSILLFPGQGSQYVGMGKQLLRYPNVSRMFAIANQILGYDLKDVCMYGPKTDLDKTIYCQPAVVVTSLAAVEKLKDESPHIIDNCVATAGFSVGEITALIFSGALSFEDGIKLVRIRAEAMQAASDDCPGGMMTVFYDASARIGFACSAAKEWCRTKGMLSPECVVANYLFPGCKVLAGDEEALKFITINAKDFGILRYKRLPVSGAFHSLLMTPAKHALKYAVESLEIKTPSVGVHSNVDGKRYRNAEHVKRQLPKQICSPVRWEQTLHVLYERPLGSNFPKTYECGPGRALRTILQKVNAKAYDECEPVEV